MFQTDLLSIIRSLKTVYTAIGIWHASCVNCLLASASEFNPDLASKTVNITSMTNTNCCEYSIKTPDDRR